MNETLVASVVACSIVYLYLTVPYQSVISHLPSWRVRDISISFVCARHVVSVTPTVYRYRVKHLSLRGAGRGAGGASKAGGFVLFAHRGGCSFDAKMRVALDATVL